MGIGFRLFCLAFLVPAAAAPSQIQSPATPWPPATTSPSPVQSPPRSVQTYDGGTRQTLESIFIPPIAHAPFSLTLETEWTRAMANGGTYTVANKRQVMRDSAGRIYQERWWLVPKDGKMESKMNFIQISDPATHTLYNCETATKQCYLQVYSGSTSASYQPAVGRSGALADGSGYATHEDLGGNMIAGFDTVGYRDTTTLNPGTYGNDQPMVSMREFWYCKQLGINLLSILDSPLVGTERFTATDVNVSEPQPRYFAIPEGYTVIDQRETGPPVR
jgi:hypothetical protein